MEGVPPVPRVPGGTPEVVLVVGEGGAGVASVLRHPGGRHTRGEGDPAPALLSPINPVT